MNVPIDRLQRRLAETLRTGAPVAIPEGCGLLWQWFCDLSARRDWHAAGPNPIRDSEIEAYARLHRWPIGPHHAEAIHALDTVYLDHCQQRTKPTPDGVKTLPPVSDRPMTGDLFDALFG